MSKKEAEVKFKADTSDLNQQIKQSESGLKTFRSELKLNETQLKGTGDKSDLLKQRLGILANEMAEAKNKTELIEEKLKKAKEVFGDNSEETNRLTRELNNCKTVETSIQNEIDKTTQELKKQGDEAKSTFEKLRDAMSGIGGKIKEVGGKITDFGKKLAPVSAGAAAIGAAAVKSAIEMDDGYDTIITKTGATGDALEELNEIADNLFTSMPIEMEDAGIAVGEINTRFGVTGDALQGLSEQFIKFSNINETDLNASIGKADKIMEQFGIDISETGNVLGLMTKKGQETGISVDALMDSVQKNGSVFKELGLNMVESTNLLAQFEANGVNADTAVAGLRKSLKAYTDDGKSVEEALQLTIDSIKNASSETEALSIAQEVFGTKGAAEMARAIQEGRFSIDDLSDSMEEYGTVVEDTFAATQDPWDQAKIMLNNMKSAGGELAGTFLESLSPAISEITEGIQSLTQWFKELDPGTQQVIGMVVIAIAILSPLVMLIGGVVTAIGTLFSPITLIVAAIAAVIAVIVLLVKNWDAVKAKAAELWEVIKECFTGIWNAITETVNSIINDISNGFNIVRNTVSSVLNTIWGVVTSIWSGIKATIAGVVDGVKTKVTTVFNAVKEAITGPLNTAKGITLGIFTSIKDGISEKIESAKETVKNAIEKIKGFFNFTWELPKLKMPSISISGKFSLNPISVPKFSIKWNKEGLILTKPTVFAKMKDTFLGGGEAGMEAVLPIEKLQGFFDSAIERAANLRITSDVLSEVVYLLQIIASKDYNLYLNGRRMSEEMAGDNDEVNGTRIDLRKRGLALS